MNKNDQINELIANLTEKLINSTYSAETYVEKIIKKVIELSKNIDQNPNDIIKYTDCFEQFKQFINGKNYDMLFYHDQSLCNSSFSLQRKIKNRTLLYENLVNIYNFKNLMSFLYYLLKSSKEPSVEDYSLQILFNIFKKFKYESNSIKSFLYNNQNDDIEFNFSQISINASQFVKLKCPNNFLDVSYENESVETRFVLLYYSSVKKTFLNILELLTEKRINMTIASNIFEFNNLNILIETMNKNDSDLIQRLLSIINYQYKICEIILNRSEITKATLEDKEYSKNIINSVELVIKYFSTKDQIEEKTFDYDIFDLVKKLFNIIYTLGLSHDIDSIDKHFFKTIDNYNIPVILYKELILFFIKITRLDKEKVDIKLNNPIKSVGKIVTIQDIKQAIRHNPKMYQKYSDREITNHSGVRVTKEDFKLIHKLPPKLIKEKKPVLKTIKFKLKQYINEEADDQNKLLEYIQKSIIIVKQAEIAISSFILFYISRWYQTVSKLEKEKKDHHDNFGLFALNKASMRHINIYVLKGKSLDDLKKLMDTNNQKLAAKIELAKKNKRKATEEAKRKTKKPKRNEDFDDEESDDASDDDSDELNEFKKGIKLTPFFIECVKDYREKCPNYQVKTANMGHLLDSMFETYESNINTYLLRRVGGLLNKHYRYLGLSYPELDQIMNIKNKNFNEILRPFETLSPLTESQTNFMNNRDVLKEFHYLWNNSIEFKEDEQHLKNRLMILAKIIDVHENVRQLDDIELESDDSDSDSIKLKKDKYKKKLESFDKYSDLMKSTKIEGDPKSKCNNIFKKKKKEKKKRKKNMKNEKSNKDDSKQNKSRKDKKKEKILNNKEKKIKIKASLIPLPSHDLGFIQFSKTSVAAMLHAKGVKYVLTKYLGDELSKDEYFNIYFNNKKMINKFNYDTRIYRANCFSTDGHVVSLVIEKILDSKQKNLQNIDKISKKPCSENLIGIDPGVNTFLTMVENKEIKKKYPKLYPKTNDNQETKSKVINVQIATPLKSRKIKSRKITTKEYYYKIGYEVRRLKINKYDKDHPDYLAYIKDMPTSKTVALDKIVKYIK
jgi:hypothetical protein